MITYELSLKLKDAGFKIRRCEYAREDMESRQCVYCEQPCFELGDTGEYYVLPTLSELIESCDKKCNDFALFHFGTNWVCGDYMPYEHDWIERAEGETLEEAVANLWLALNKK